MEHRVKSFLVILALATLAQYSAQETSSSSESSSTVKNPITIEVFYEGHSEESKKFIKDQLIPTNAVLSEYIDIKLMPFALGHITEKPVGNNTEYTITCGEDNSKCIEDKVHACAIENIKTEKLLLDFIKCTVETKAADSEILKKCADEIKLEPTLTEKITNCMNNNTIIHEVLGKYEAAHKSANINNVPTVYVANNKNKENVEAAKEDLKKAVCQSIPDPKPSQCAANTNGADAIIAGVLPLLIGAYFFIKTF